MTATVIVPSLAGGEPLRRLLESLRGQTVEHEVIVLENGPAGGPVAEAAEGFTGVRVVALGENLGFGRAMNRGAREADTDAIVFVNDDCVCDPEFVERLVSALNPPAGVVAVAGVLRDGRDPQLIDSAGVEVAPGLLGGDYLNGEPIGVLEAGVEPPLGPCGGAAAYDRAAFLEIGGYDEGLFAYWEDVDLALRLAAAGRSCRLAPDARATHEHSATLGSGSARKNYLMGYGRGYTLRKWNALTPRRAPAVFARDLVICAGQAVLDRNLAGVRGRIAGYRAARPEHDFPAAAIASSPRSPGAGLIRRLRRRRALAKAAHQRSSSSASAAPARDTSSRR